MSTCIPISVSLHSQYVIFKQQLAKAFLAGTKINRITDNKILVDVADFWKKTLVSAVCYKKKL